MNKLIIFLLSFMIFSSCAKEGLKCEKSNNQNFYVTLLFEHDGIRVYRFYDEGRYHWFTSKDECLSPYKYKCGKVWIERDEVL